MKKFTEKITTYITPKQKEWVQKLPKNFNLSEKMRNYLEELIKGK